MLIAISMKTVNRENYVSTRDIAAAARVSQTTVSFVLNGLAEKHRISARTNERVKRVIAESGYTLPEYDRAVPGADVGIAVPAGKPELDEVLAKVQPALVAAGYHVEVVQLPPEPKKAGRQLATLARDGMTAIVYCPKEVKS